VSLPREGLHQEFVDASHCPSLASRGSPLTTGWWDRWGLISNDALAVHPVVRAQSPVRSGDTPRGSARRTGIGAGIIGIMLSSVMPSMPHPAGVIRFW